MNGFAILMLIFSVCLFIVGLLGYTGHGSELFLTRLHTKSNRKGKAKNVGKWIMISSIIPLIIAVLAFVFNVY